MEHRSASLIAVVRLGRSFPIPTYNDYYRITTRPTWPVYYLLNDRSYIRRLLGSSCLAPRNQGCGAQGTVAVVLDRDEILPVRERAIKKADKLLPSLVENITNIIILLFDGAITMYL